jgi:hypothetical protein
VTGLVGRGGETPNIGTFGTVLLVLVCGPIEGGTLTFDFSTIEETIGFDGWVGTASRQHFSGYFFAYSSCARANFGHENGVIWPSTFGFVISFVGLIGSIVIELFVWIDESVGLVDCTFSIDGTDNASFRISAGGNVRWIFLFGSIELSVIEILHWIPHSFSDAFIGFRIGEAAVDICSSIVDIDNGSLSSVRLRRIQSCKVRRRSLSI